MFSHRQKGQSEPRGPSPSPPPPPFLLPLVWLAHQVTPLPVSFLRPQRGPGKRGLGGSRVESRLSRDTRGAGGCLAVPSLLARVPTARGRPRLGISPRKPRRARAGIAASR